MVVSDLITGQNDSTDMTIGEYELAVLKAIHNAGGTISLVDPVIDVDCRIDGDLGDAVSKLCADEYVEQNASDYRLTELAAEYLELLGMH